MNLELLDFKPLIGCSSPHVQTLLAACLKPGDAPASKSWHVSIGRGDFLSCEVSTPPIWQENGKCIVLVHGLGGSHNSAYMVRMARRFYDMGHKVVRVNLRGCGSGKLLSKLPYHGGTSFDVEHVLRSLRQEHPNAEITLIGFSLGANVVLKLVGELGNQAEELMQTCIAICPPIDLYESVRLIEKWQNRLYHKYFLKRMNEQIKPFTQAIASTLYEFDDTITAPFWGYDGACHYYEEASSKHFLSEIKIPSRMLFAMDDPFIHMHALPTVLPNSVTVCATKHGGHMGFFGYKGLFPYWLDNQLLKWV